MNEPHLVLLYVGIGQNVNSRELTPLYVGYEISGKFYEISQKYRFAKFCVAKFCNQPTRLICQAHKKAQDGTDCSNQQRKEHFLSVVFSAFSSDFVTRISS
jgi:hypothetical protein